MTTPKVESRRRRQSNDIESIARSNNEHKQPIGFESFMKNLTIEEGNRAKFICGVIGQVTSVDWYKDNKLLKVEMDRRYRFTLSDGLIGLEINSVLIGDSGFYTCTINGQRNSITSSSKLTVYESYKPQQKSVAYESPSIRSQLSAYIAKGNGKYCHLENCNILVNDFIVKIKFHCFFLSFLRSKRIRCIHIARTS